MNRERNGSEQEAHTGWVERMRVGRKYPIRVSQKAKLNGKVTDF